VDPERLRSRRPDGRPLSYFLFGTPEEVATAIRDHVGQAPVRTVWLGGSIAGFPEDVAVRHVRTICTRLRPLLEKE
jgi:alkanesulfonate monooxygenase SsuD/methylene tetrahydromethanopterin reductase-like flavin-dependent oxidoreductase (luciferase family)